MLKLMKRGRGSAARQISGLENVKVGGGGGAGGGEGWGALQDGSIYCITLCFLLSITGFSLGLN